MPLIPYVPKRFIEAHELMIARANTIMSSYTQKLTLRQLYYRFVALDKFPDDRRWTWTGSRWRRDPDGTKNADPNYKWLGGIVTDARLAGRIDWDAIEDRGRGLMGINAFDDPADIISQMQYRYHLDHWADQDVRVEVWVEKQALEGVIGAACRPLDVDFFSCKGYMSASEMWRAAMRFERYIDGGQEVVMIHLGDHDPSGIDMTRDMSDRTVHVFGVPIEVDRIALNMDQVEEFDPPPNPAKLTDSRVGGYLAEYGSDSWELDALEPAYLEQVITEAVWARCDRAKWDAVDEQQEKERKLLRAASRRWDELVDVLEEDDDDDDE